MTPPPSTRTVDPVTKEVVITKSTAFGNIVRLTNSAYRQLGGHAFKERFAFLRRQVIPNRSLDQSWRNGIDADWSELQCQPTSKGFQSCVNGPLEHRCSRRTLTQKSGDER